MAKRNGFTLIELIIYLTLFGVLSVIFTSIFFITSRSQSRQVAEAEVNQQSNFILQTIQRLVASTSTVAIMARDDTDESGDGDDEDVVGGGGRLILRLRNIPSNTASGGTPGNSFTNAFDPIQIYRDNSQSPPAIVMKKGRGASATATNLTTNKVIVDALNFTKLSSAAGHHGVLINLTLTYNAAAPNNVSRVVRSAISRVSAASFDDNVYPFCERSGLLLCNCLFGIKRSGIYSFFLFLEEKI